jgi:pimeloyl-ACP methyl ester carboxylesterase
VRLAGFVAERRADLSHADVRAAGEVHDVVMPEMLLDLAMSDQFGGAARQQRQEPQWLRLQPHRAPKPVQGRRIDPKLEIPEGKQPVRHLRSLACEPRGPCDGRLDSGLDTLRRRKFGLKYPEFRASAARAAAFVLASLVGAGAAAASDRKEGRIATDDGVQLHYTESGKGAPVVVPFGFYLEPYLLEHLARRHRVIFYDPRNRGRSQAAPLSSVSLDRQLRDLENLRAALELERFALIGWSGMGMETVAYALRHPERVSRLIQIAPVPPAASIMREAGDARAGRVDQAAQAALDARQKAGEFESDPGRYCRLDQEISMPANFVDASLAREVVDVCVHDNEHPARLWPYFGALLPSFGDYDHREALHELTVPRLVIHGREDGIPLAGARAWAAGYGQARILVVSPAGHFPFIEQRAIVLAAIDEFLDGRWPEAAQRIE